MSRSYIFVKLRDKNGDTPEERKFRKICEQILIKNYKKSSVESPEDKFRKLIQGFLFEDLTLKTNTLDDFDELESNQDFSNLFKDLEEKPAEEEPEPTEEVTGDPEAKELDRTGARAGDTLMDEISPQIKNSYEDLSNKKDQTLYQNWYYINKLLFGHQQEGSIEVPKGVEKTDPDEFIKTIDMTGIADDLEVKTASPGEEVGPNVEPAAFNRDENNKVTGYDIIDQYLEPTEDPESTDENVEVGAQPTGINALGDYFNKVKEKIAAKYKTLTSDPEQRTAFLQTIMNRSKALFDEMDAKLENPGVSTEE